MAVRRLFWASAKQEKGGNKWKREKRELNRVLREMSCALSALCSPAAVQPPAVTAAVTWRETTRHIAGNLICYIFWLFFKGPQCCFIYVQLWEFIRVTFRHISETPFESVFFSPPCLFKIELFQEIVTLTVLSFFLKAHCVVYNHIQHLEIVHISSRSFRSDIKK